MDSHLDSTVLGYETIRPTSGQGMRRYGYAQICLQYPLRP